MKKTVYLAHRVPVLNFSRTPDSTGMVIPPEAFAQVPTSVPVMIGDEVEHHVGSAKLYRLNNQLLADMELRSTMEDQRKALALMAGLYPALEFQVLEMDKNHVFKLKVVGLFLTWDRNDDLLIPTLAHYLQPKNPAKEGH